METTKQCTKCKTIKNISEFAKAKDKKDGRASNCKICVRANYKTYYNKNKKEILAKNKEWRDDHKEEMLGWGRDSYHRNSEKHIMKSTKWRVDNIEKARECAREYRKNNKEKVKKQSQKYRSSDRWKMVKAAHSHKRRIEKHSTSDGSVVVAALQQLIEKQNYQCNNCKCDITNDKHLDHHIPLSKGGTHSINNVVWLCPSCNLSKSNKMPKELLLI